MLYAIRLDFDPVISPLGLSIRLETLALAGVILLALIVAGLMAGRARIDGERNDPGDQESRLQRDDLILIAFGAVPGAVAGGRLGYGLAHLDYYISDPGALLDPGKGSLSLTAALLLGTVTALAVARLVGAPSRAWLYLAAPPLLLGLGLGKLAMALGGSGQGAYSDASWATAYTAPGRWGSLNPADPAIPAQLIEGGLVLLVMACLLLVPRLLRVRVVLSRRPGLRLAPAGDWLLLAGHRRFLTALALWAAVRMGVAFTWRDGRVAGPLSVEQLALAAVIGVCLWALARPWLQERQLRSATLDTTPPPETPPAAPPPAAPTAAPTAAPLAVTPPVAAPEYPREERGSEVQGVPERERVEPAQRPSPRRARTHRRIPPGSGF